MDYTQLSEDDAQQMLRTIGVDSLDGLFAPIRPEQRFTGSLDVPPGVSEFDLMRELESLARKNAPVTENVCFLGGGAYDHFIPTIVDHLAMQSEFLTAYTPYQAEASQGALQVFYEFQTMVCQLTGMDVSNASLYELASAVAEAVLMARSITGKRRVIMSKAAHPDCNRVLDTYVRELPIEPVHVNIKDGLTDLDHLRSLINNDTACVVVQSPNFFGCIERVDQIVKMAHAAGALVIQAFDPISCGILKRPGDLEVDIAVAEGQALGIPLQYGGPWLGILACREAYLRRMPGRVVGVTNDKQGRRGFCLVLQTREQHIKRERATSNVCTNQGLLAIRASVYMAAMGRHGLAKVATLCLDKAHYAASQIANVPGFALRFNQPFFKEFAVRTTKPMERVMAACRANGILAGVPLARWFPEFEDTFVVAVTEKRTKDEIDRFVEILRAV
jgi:glycine dehydrogenase subunit 1